MLNKYSLSIINNNSICTFKLMNLYLFLRNRFITLDYNKKNSIYTNIKQLPNIYHSNYIHLSNMPSYFTFLTISISSTECSSKEELKESSFLFSSSKSNSDMKLKSEFKSSSYLLIMHKSYFIS